ncbi:hypothetical protein [Bradyrhizobium lupini]|uniref:hypothetical protein n=1 Tax=Rhizobium lupini TaxID=136996 RepID=UPI0034C633FD
MYRVVIALVLLITPAAAETYTARECETIGMLFANCAIRPSCEDVRSGYEARRLREIMDNHESWIKETELEPGQRPFNQLCQQVCDGKMTAASASRKYCPARPRS